MKAIRSVQAAEHTFQMMIMRNMNVRNAMNTLKSMSLIQTAGFAELQSKEKIISINLSLFFYELKQFYSLKAIFA